MSFKTKAEEYFRKMKLPPAKKIEVVPYKTVGTLIIRETRLHIPLLDVARFGSDAHYLQDPAEGYRDTTIWISCLGKVPFATGVGSTFIYPVHRRLLLLTQSQGNFTVDFKAASHKLYLERHSALARLARTDENEEFELLEIILNHPIEMTDEEAFQASVEAAI